MTLEIESLMDFMHKWEKHFKYYGMYSSAYKTFSVYMFVQ